MNVLVKVPSTSANLGPGFDILGIAFNLFNKYLFEESLDNEVIGFDSKYDVSNNLVLFSYLEVFKYLKKEVIPVRITLLEENIPISRGLGSSASCIVAGILGADAILKSHLDNDALLEIATKIEGHPDNVAPSLFGGLIASYKTSNSVQYIKYEVSKELKFMLFVPDFELRTEESRKVLSNAITYDEYTYNASRLINLPYAFKIGDIALLKDLMDDKIHEPYRFKLILDSLEIRDLAHSLGYAFALSGAGPSLIAIGNDTSLIDKFKCFKTKATWKVLALDVSKSGASVEVL